MKCVVDYTMGTKTSHGKIVTGSLPSVREVSDSGSREVADIVREILEREPLADEPKTHEGTVVHALMDRGEVTCVKELSGLLEQNHAILDAWINQKTGNFDRLCDIVWDGLNERKRDNMRNRLARVLPACRDENLARIALADGLAGIFKDRYGRGL